MVATASKDWILAPRIYVENRRERDHAYSITESMVREAIATETNGQVAPKSITVAFSDERDVDAWSRADILVAGRLDTKEISGMGSLRLIQCTNAGIESYLPLDWVPAHAEFFNASGAHADKVGQFGAMAVLMLHEHVPLRMSAQFRREWLRTLRPTTHGRQVLIFGAGSLGGAVARSVQPFGFVVKGIAKHAQGPRPGFDEIHGSDKLEDLLPETDILVLSSPLTAETRGRFGRRELARLRKGAAVLNIARSAIMDYGALADLLEAGHLSGAILDVFEKEPLPEDSRWWRVPNLMVFPHVSSDDPTNYAQACLQILATNLDAMLAGRPVRNRVDPELGY